MYGLGGEKPQASIIFMFFMMADCCDRLNLGCSMCRNGGEVMGRCFCCDELRLALSSTGNNSNRTNNADDRENGYDRDNRTAWVRV